MDASAANPLLDFSGLPRFESIRAEHVTPAVDTLLEQARASVERVAQDTGEPTWDNVVEPLADALDHLERAWGAVRHLNAVVSTPELRDAYNGNLPRITAFHTELAQDVRLYARYRALRESTAFAAARCGAAQAARQRAARFPARRRRAAGREEGALQGAAGGARVAVRAVRRQRARRHQRLDAVRGRREGPRRRAAGRRRRSACRGGKRRQGGLEAHPAHAVLPAGHAVRGRPHAARRRCIARFVTRASDLGAKPDWDNTAIIGEILKLRHEESVLLGYRNFAEVSLVPKMAASSDEVLAFLRDLAARAKPFAERDYAELVAFARTDLGLDATRAVGRRVRIRKAQGEALRVLRAGSAAVLPRAQGARRAVPRRRDDLRRSTSANRKAPTWHPTCASSTSSIATARSIGQFYLDNYARDGQAGRRVDGRRDQPPPHRRPRSSIPVAYLTCNLLGRRSEASPRPSPTTT